MSHSSKNGLHLWTKCVYNGKCQMAIKSFFPGQTQIELDYYPGRDIAKI